MFKHIGAGNKFHILIMNKVVGWGNVKRTDPVIYPVRGVGRWVNRSNRLNQFKSVDMVDYRTALDPHNPVSLIRNIIKIRHVNNYAFN